MCPAIDNPASCKIRAVIHFQHAKSMSAMEMHCELYVVYSQNVMIEGAVGQCRTVGGEQMSTVKREMVSLPSAVSESCSKC
jgi:hypothetical protein